MTDRDVASFAILGVAIVSGLAALSSYCLLRICKLLGSQFDRLEARVSKVEEETSKPIPIEDYQCDGS
jgi:hypothetical protein